MKRNKIIAGILMLIIFVCGLNGVWLADETAAAPKKEDQLIGVLITKDYLDLFDMEGYLNDHIEDMMNGDAVIDSSDSAYNEKLYANLTTKELIDEETKETSTTTEYKFEDIDGLCFMAPLMKDAEGDYVAIYADDAITEGNQNISIIDNSREVLLEGTIYVSDSNSSSNSDSDLEDLISFYLNPVYQTEDGKVYALAGSGLSSNSYLGASMTQTLSATTTETENGIATSNTTTVKVTIAVCAAPFEATILQMDSTNQILSSATYDIQNLPDSITPLADTAYLLVETHSKDAEGIITTDRILFSPSDETLSIFQPQDDRLCTKKLIPLNWIQ